MRKILLIGLVFSSVCAKAQTKEGIIIYEKKVNLHKQFTDPQMQAMMPEYRVNKYTLAFNDSSSLYKAYVEDEAPDPFGGGGGGVRFAGPGDGGDLYKNYNEGKLFESREMGKTYLIEDSLRKQKWKMTTETKQILGHNCHKAVAKATRQNISFRRVTVDNSSKSTTDTTTQNKAVAEMEIVAWFADDIQSPAGPDAYGGLPGAILELNVDNSITVFKALEIKNTVTAKDVKAPTKGKKVTRDEFNKIMKDAFQNSGGSFRTMN